MLPNVRLDGEIEAIGTAATPVPVKGTSCGLFDALSTKWRLAALAPAVVGENCTETVQLADTPKEAPQVLAVIEKSPGFVPVKDTTKPDRIAVPVLVKVTVDEDELWPTTKLPKDTEVGLNDAAGAVPVPFSATV